MMVKRIDSLTADQTAQITAHADKWMAIGLRIGAADRPAFGAAARKCYEYAQIPWHDNVIWVGSPLVVALGGSIADILVELHPRGIFSPRDAVDSVKRLLKRPLRPRRVGVDDTVRDAVADAVDDTVRNALGRLVCEPVIDAVYNATVQVVRGAVEDAVSDAVANEVSGTVYSAMSGAMLDMVRRAVDDTMREAVGGARPHLVRGVVAALIRQAIPQLIELSWYRTFGGQFAVDDYYLGVILSSFFREVCGLDLAGDLWDRGVAYEKTMQSACRWYAHREFLMVCEHPREIHLELSNPDVTRGRGSHRLHRTDGPAISWPDGWSVYAVHGTRVPAWIIEHPAAVTARKIELERNAEVRRVMLDRYGWGRYITDSGAQIVDQVPADHEIVGLRGARLLRKDLPDEPEPIVYLDMINSSPEPDGSYKHYLERIDPKAYNGDAGRLCHAAMASLWHYRDDDGRLVRTFARWQDYQPTAES